MPRFNLYIFILAVIAQVFIVQSSYGQTHYENNPVYPEIEEYHRTLTPERQQAYEDALARYVSEPLVQVPVTANHRLAESYTDIITLPETDAAEVSDKIVALQKLSAEASRKKETHLELECLYQAFMLAFWSDYRDYAKGFELALLMEERLGEVTENQYPDRRNAYFRISEGYYLFKEYDKSIKLALQAITDTPAHSFTDRANLEGRKILAMAYGTIGEFDLSYKFIRSTWNSPDIVEDRPVFDAMALAHKACDEMDMGNWRKALVLNTEVLDYLKTSGDYGHVAGMYACQCFCYFGLGEPENVGSAADSILVYARRDWYNQNKRLKQAYKNLSRYNGIIGNVSAMQEYQDSLIAIYEREEAMATSQYLLRAEQQVALDKIQQREENLTRQQRITAGVICALTLILIFLTIILRLYRREQTAYKALVTKAEQWTNYKEGSAKVATDNALSKEETLLANKLSEFMTAKQPYTDPNLHLNSLASMLDMNRNQLSRIINKSFGVNFNQYVNEYRVRYAVRILSDPLSKNLSMEHIMERAGFNNRNSFYAMFKQTIGLTPAQYRKAKSDLSKEHTIQSDNPMSSVSE